MHCENPIQVFINKRKYELKEALQTGGSLKQLAGLSLNDVLFLQAACEDEVIPNDGKVVLRDCDSLHSQPPADYGLGVEELAGMGITAEKAVIHSEPGGWSFLVISDYALPAGFQPDRVDLLVKLPPGFPDAAPDMFWVSPEVRTANGGSPKATSTERLLGKAWQRFSWHLAAGAWKPGVSDLRDFMRCVTARFFRMD